MGSRCGTRWISHWNKICTSRSTQTCAVWVRRLCREHGVLRRFAICCSGFHFRIHTWVCLFLHHHSNVHRGAESITTTGSRSRDVTVVHGVWRNCPTWQHGLWSSDRSIRSTLVVALWRSVGALPCLVVQRFCTRCKTRFFNQ